ncbi:polyprenyl synthetase family protein [Bacteroides sp. 224]|uniref:polyprenyl synthetase family protein n=1 Tax=Bacteroides sp. 224 TaxID=2302936 RepID=UPI0013D8791D|nr:polyprenyl synthetase family protein [Bacteroides sp. 224]NDV65615.1 polyprenyl synthetase family protein [Bacteroides sp. 224]
MYTIKELQNEINTYIADIKLVHPPVELYNPIDYIMSMGGKRVRPVLMLLAYNLYKENLAEVLPPAAGVEIFHNYTLLHDDLMDKADMRRGKKTVHLVWNDNAAILSGDVMFVIANQYIAKTPIPYLKEILDLFNTTAVEVCEGQQYDVDFEKRSDVAATEYLEMIRLKTAVLLACGLKMGAILGDASPKDAQLLYDFGIHLGLAFQLKDDYLDVYGDSQVFGKNIGGDILCNKKTYMLIKALEEANEQQRAELNQWLNAVSYNPQEKIRSVTALYEQIGVKNICEAKMQEYYSKAIEFLDEVSVSDNNKNELRKLVHELMYREI